MIAACQEAMPWFLDPSSVTVWPAPGTADRRMCGKWTMRRVPGSPDTPTEPHLCLHRFNAGKIRPGLSASAHPSNFVEGVVPGRYTNKSFWGDSAGLIIEQDIRVLAFIRQKHLL